MSEPTYVSHTGQERIEVLIKCISFPLVDVASVSMKIILFNNESS